MKTLKSLWHRWEQTTTKVDNPIGRTVLTALLIGLLYKLHEHWWSKLFIILYMLTLGKFVFGVLSRTILTLIYVLMMTPVGVFVRMGDPLRIRPKSGNSYWIPRGTPDESMEGASKQG